MNRKAISITTILIFLQLASCTPSAVIPVTGDESTPAVTRAAEGGPTEAQSILSAPSSIGTVSNEKTQVHAGARDHLQLVDGTAPLGNDDYVSVTDGGKARLEFPGPINLLLFNDSEVDGIKLEADKEKSNPIIIHRLLRGGYLGYVAPGNQLTVDFEFDVKVNVLGTHFFIIYDEENGVITVGKFDGTLTVNVPGQPVMKLDDSELVDITADKAVKRYSPFRFTTGQFEEMADSCNSPVQGLNILRRDHEVPLPGTTDAGKTMELPCGSSVSIQATSTSVPVVNLDFCSRSREDICIYTVGLLKQDMMITLSVKRENILEPYILLENGNLYPCKEVTTGEDKYYCVGKQIRPNQNIMAQVFHRDHVLLAQGNLLISSLVPTPKPRPAEDPCPRYSCACGCG